MAAPAPRTFLIDGSALAYRCFFARGPGPAYAYAASLLSLVERGAPDYALVAMDTPQPTFRHEAFPAYKATREKTPVSCFTATAPSGSTRWTSTRPCATRSPSSS